MEIKITEKKESAREISTPSYWTNGTHYRAIISESRMITTVNYPGYEQVVLEHNVRLSEEWKAVTRAEFLEVYGGALQSIGDNLNDSAIQKTAA